VGPMAGLDRCGKSRPPPGFDPRIVQPVARCYTDYAHLNNSHSIKCTLVQALRLCTGRTAHRGSRGIALPFLDHGTRRG
jgi:hypothetical protein